MSRLLLVRHGTTEYNSSLRFLGHSDVPLDSSGYQQAERLRRRLAAEKIDAVYASDLVRALATAERICEDRGIDIRTCPALREMDFGKCEGLTFQEIAERYPGLAAQFDDASAGLEFPGGEAFGMLAERVGGFLAVLGKHPAEETVLVVSHGGPLRVLVCRLLGIDLAHWWQFRLDTGSISSVDTRPRGAAITFMNDTSHLESGVFQEGMEKR